MKKRFWMAAAACFVLAAVCILLPAPWTWLRVTLAILSVPLLVGAMLLVVNALLPANALPVLGLLGYGIFAAFIIANVLMLILGLIAIRGSNKIIAIPSGVLMPIVVTLCAVGGYAVNNNMFDLLIVAIFGVVGYFMIKCDIPQPPMLLAMILAGIAETNFRRALSISQNDYSIFYTSPVAMCILAVSLFVLIKPIYDSIRAALRGENIAEE